MHDEEADLSDLRASGSRAFVHIETYTPKLGEKVSEGKLCYFSQDSRAHQIYKLSKGTVVERRNVTFLEAPPYSMPPMGVEYSIDIIDLTTSLDFTIFNTPKEGAIAALEAASEEENATSEGGASCDPRVEPISSGVVPAGEPAAQPGVTPSTAHLRPNSCST